MRLSSRFVAPSMIVVLSTALLCVPGGTALSQTASSSLSLPDVTVVAPKRPATPHRRREHAASIGAGHRTAPATRTSAQTTTRTPSYPPGSVMAKLAEIERTSSNCTDGCQTSFRHGNQPWNGCSTTGDIFSATCRNVNNFKNYAECREYGLLTGWQPNAVWWYCTSLLAGKYKVADLRRPGR